MPTDDKDESAPTRPDNKRPAESRPTTLSERLDRWIYSQKTGTPSPQGKKGRGRHSW